MRRDVEALEAQFDVLIIGAGMHGVAAARLAAHAGLGVAIIDRGDFCSATSRNSARLVHGGLRYVQHLDFARVRESAAAQRDWRIAAPHLVRPLRFMVPAYGWGSRGPAALAAGMVVYELLAAGRNSGVPPADRMPRSGILRRRRLVRRFPVFDQHGITGGAHWHEARILDASRLAFACLEDAHSRGATIANHVEATSLLEAGRTIHGAAVRDRLTGREFEIRARIVVDATGPWTGRLARASGLTTSAAAGLSRHVNLVTRRIFPEDVAVGVASRHASDAVVGRSRRLLFVSPWRDCSIVGTWHDEFRGDPADLEVTGDEVERWLSEINDALPAARLGLDDVRSVHAGVIPVAAAEAGRASRDLLTDHSEHGLAGLISVAGTKLTTAPLTAGRVLTMICRGIGVEPEGGMPRFAVPLRESSGAGLSAVDTRGRDPVELAEPLAWIARIYGARAAELLTRYGDDSEPVVERAFRRRIRYGLRHEMVVTLGDALFRATDHAERGTLSEADLQWAATALAADLGWSSDRRARDIESVRARLAAMRSVVRPSPPEPIRAR